MLQTTLLASAGLLLSGNRALGGILRSAFGAKRICVVGAGFSGLACAYELLAAGYDVTVIEARGRVGGRVLSFSDLVPGKNVEGGGELIGSNHPTWVAYKEKFNLEFLDVTEDEEAEFPIVLGGQRLSKDEASALYEQMDAALSVMNADAAKVPADEPWTAPDAATLDKRSTQQWIAAQDVPAICKMGIAAMLTADNGASPSMQSYLGNLSQVSGGGLEKYWTDSEVFRCKGGNQQLATILAKEIGAAKLVLNVSVRQINIGGNSVKIACGDGRTLEVDDVVLAVPPSVWKKIEITPALPAALAPQMGVNVKYLAAVKSRFWKESKVAPDSLTDSMISMTWDGTDNQGDGSPPSPMAALNSFSGGPGAAAARAIEPAKRDAAYADALEALYPGFKGHANGGGRFMDWPGDTWTQAGYSFPAPGQVTTMGPLMAQAHGGGRLHLAGEHCCYKFVGYMEGALNSGVTVAKRLAKRDGVAK